VEANGLDLAQLKKVVLQSIKYEEPLSLIMQLVVGRRAAGLISVDGGGDSGGSVGTAIAGQCLPFLSNEQALLDSLPDDCRLRNQRVFAIIKACTSVKALVYAVNPQETAIHSSGRGAFKLDLRSLLDSSARSTIDFRHNASGGTADDVVTWTRLINRFVDTALNVKAPMNLKDGSVARDKLEKLFQYGVKDAALREWGLGGLTTKEGA
jgi:hypothetical protein